MAVKKRSSIKKPVAKKALKKAAAKKKVKAPVSRPVIFTDVKIIAAARLKKNPLGFPDEQGTYENPDVVISGGQVPILPQNVACVGKLIIYSSWAQIVANCAGFKGPGAGNNAVVAAALKNAQAVAARIPCGGDCVKTVTEIWRGWDCGANPLTATGAVELKISCDIANPQ